VDDLSRLDWNLLPVLDALLHERSVSRAANRLGLAQPTVSGALARLRRRYGDELLVRRGAGYDLSPLARHLAPLVEAAVESARRVVVPAEQFDAARTTRRFTVAASDYAQLVLGGRLHRAFALAAPSAELHLVSPFTPRFRSNGEILVQTDGWIAPQEVMPGANRTGALPDRWVCVVARDHPTASTPLRLEDAASLDWVAPTLRGELLGVMTDDLRALGVEPRVAVTTDGFVGVPFLVGGTHRVGMVQERLALLLADRAEVRISPCPWPVQALSLTFWWDQSRAHDPAHVWLRELVDDCFAATAPTAQSG